jgi:UDP-glucose 4-epimerase
MDNKKILITGGAGFIGQHLASRFMEGGQKVHIYDVEKPVTGDQSTVGDIFDSGRLEDAVKDCDVVVHLVGLADSGVAQREPAKSFKLNVESLQAVLEACRVCNSKMLIFPSSAAVYGYTEDLPITEKTPVKPNIVYAWHKYICEGLIKAYNDSYGLNFVILRLFNVYGKGNKGVIGAFLDKAKAGETIESFGPYQYRDFIYAGDVSEAMYRAVIYEKAMNRIINIGSGQGTQIREIFELLSEIYPQAKWVKVERPFPMYDSIADITLAKILLDFKPHTSREFMKEIIVKEMI